MPFFFVDMPVCNQHFTVIRVRRNNESSWVEFRADGIQQWTEHEACMTDAQRLHDAMAGWHTCILYAGDAAAICPHHPDFEAVRTFFEKGAP